MFGINNEKLMDKLMEEVLPKIKEQNTTDLVKYNLALRYLSEVTDIKKLVCALGTTIGVTGFFVLQTPMMAALFATGAVAGTVEFVKNNKLGRQFDLVFKALSLALEHLHEETPESVKAILDDITVDDLIEFLDNKDLLK